MAGLDLYDWEIQNVAAAYAAANHLCMNTRATADNIRETGLRIQEIFVKAGFLVNVDMAPCLILKPNGLTDSPKVEIIGRVDDPYGDKEFDHDEKGFEVRDSKQRGEKYRGDKERVNKRRTY